MANIHRVLWGEGVFLRPQHFQQQALYSEWLGQNAARLARSYPWGVAGIEIDQDALSAGTLRANHITAMLPDGAIMDAPANEPLPPTRNLNEIPNVGTETIVYLCLPALNAYGGNSLEPGQIPVRPTRYSIEQVPLSDLYTGGLETEIAALRANSVLMTLNENRDGYASVPIARLQKSSTGTWRQDEEFIPPLIDINASDALHRMLRRLLDILFVKSQALGGMHRERAKSVAEYSTSDIASFWLLHTTNRSFPALSHMLAHANHPETLYLALAQLAGELLTFSTTLTLNAIPPYDHNNLTDTFGKLDVLIRELLDTVISARYMVIPLENPKASFYIGRLNSERLLENVDFYLSVESELPAVQVIETVPLKFKVGSPDDVEKILNSALPGVRLAHAGQTPAAIPVRVGNHYFSLEPHGQIFERMLKSRSICLYVPQTLIQLKLELIAVFR